MNRGVVAAQSGKLASGVELVREAIAAYPGNASAYYNLGHLLRRSGDLAGARDAFKKGAYVAPEGDAIGVEMEVQLGSVLLELSSAAGTSAVDRERRLREALKALDRAITADPNAAEAYRIRGMTFDRLGDARTADSDLRRCIQINPRNGRCWAALGQMYAEHGFVQEGIEIVELGAKVNDADWAMWMGSAKVHMIANETQAAVDSYQRARSISPDSPEVWYGLGVVYTVGRRRREAVVALKNFLRLAGPTVGEGRKRAVLNTIARLEDTI